MANYFLNIHMQITSDEIREKYIKFFEGKDHKHIPSASVVPENDPTVLFTTAGMQPLTPYLLWEHHPLWHRLTNHQKCIRTNDIEEVWDNTHLTFFEMLWNWSLNDYFKKESITWSWEFLTDPRWLWLDPKMIRVTVFEWDSDAPRDTSSAEIWQNLWMNNISYLGKKDNWWWPAGVTGPCGPDTEIFYWVGETPLPHEGSTVANDEDNWMEIWNNVFMEYIKNEDGHIVKASLQNVDTGMGLERITRVLTEAPSVYETDIFSDIIDKICEVLDVKYEDHKKSIRIIRDHTRTSVVMISDGVRPSNIDRWYILRRLLRRAIREWNKLWANSEFLSEIAIVVINKFWNVYSNIEEKRDGIIREIIEEEKQFLKTLTNWLKEFNKLIKWFEVAYEKTGRKITTIPWAKAFKLYDTYGFPIEITKDLASEYKLDVDIEWFEKAYKDHQELSRIWATKKFKWWLSDDSEATTALHSATHLMLRGLRKVLWDHVHQAGSNITPDRTRFDFNYNEKLTPEQIKAVEDYVNEAISQNSVRIVVEMPKQQALDEWVEWSFWEKYPDIVKVWTFTWQNWVVYSRELCGWPHVETTIGMWVFKIEKEWSSSKWIRRIKAILKR